jgi:benzoyl-CoA reductase/2-hydroxyglutaryl-CoA dehydratase subunit BcrC/BadD/HgdB
MIEEILNTKELMRRKYFHVDCDKCVLCDQTSIKEVKHLVFEVKLCRNFLWMLNHEWDVDLLLIEMIADGK